MNIRKATTNDVDTIVKIHCDAFKGFFLTSLGSQFLKFYYSCFIKSSETVTMVAEEDDAIFVLPTYTEGFPNVILECMASGCPIITTPVGAIPDMLQFDSSQACGACVDVKDVQGLKKTIEKQLNNYDSALLMAEKAKQRVIDNYSMPSVWKQLVSIWNMACNCS